MKKILHLIWRFEGGGIESFCFNLLKSVNQEEYHFDFAVCGGELPSEKMVLDYNSKIYHLPYVSGKKGKKEYLEALDRVLSEHEYDVVHSHLAFLNISTLKLAKKHNIPIRISHVHVAGYGRSNSPITLFKRWLIKRYSTYCIACSQNSAAYYYGHFSEKIMVIHSAIDMYRYRKRTDKDNMNDPNEVLICSRFAPEKNPSFILRVIEELSELDSNIRFRWIGATFKDAMNIMRGDVGGYCVDSQIFIGYVPSPEIYMRNAGYLLMPSIKEGMGMAAIEAQLSGCFVFASDKIPKDTDLGFIAYWPLESGPKAWAQKIHSFIINNEVKNYNLSNRTDRFDIKCVAERITKMYLHQ